MDSVLDCLSALGLGGVVLGTVLEALGVPFFPGAVVMILAGVLVHQGALNFPATLGAAFGGYTVGSVLAYLLGKNVGTPFFRRYGRFLHVSPEKLMQAQTLPAYSAGFFVLLGRFVPGVGNLTPYLAGLAQLQVGWFLLYNSLYALGWGTVYLGVGMFFGSRWPAIITFIQPRLLGIAVLGGLAVVAVMMHLDRKR
ncbi:DedA family protein [Candidatus Desulforudis audaxviator]|uniref:Alkaline phosphatase, DedA family n=1 Tax=Desulforudis audaxviator (strain MP104C) TaxID=477974 RepID=B1I3H1_DESAP|nr:DedA family protein [Candidatus Desulforudis audaxviator]ACA59569.1 alkaline phosphatase, DedA family [Candidatus Desulforudis audaxviator MP104C]AZK59553.1 Alkaline phosphatase like protein [Candidatus Desulforudis audaxviator]